MRAPLVAQRQRTGGAYGKRDGCPCDDRLVLRLVGDDRLRPRAVDKAEHEAGKKKVRFRFHSRESGA